MFSTASFKHIYRILLGCLLISGCSKNIDPNKIDEIKLKSDNWSATLRIPAVYKVKETPDSMISFRVKYPGMEPLELNSMPQDNAIRVWIEFWGEERIGTTNAMREKAIKQFDPKRPGLDYRAGQEGIYELYRYSQGHGDTEVEITTHAFQAKDGQWVSVKDPGNWSVNYNVHRKIGAHLNVDYVVPKPLGKDFIRTDEIVTDFINSRIAMEFHKE